MELSNDFLSAYNSTKRKTETAKSTAAESNKTFAQIFGTRVLEPVGMESIKLGPDHLL